MDYLLEPIVCACCGEIITGPYIVDEQTLECFCSRKCVELYDEWPEFFRPDLCLL